MKCVKCGAEVREGQRFCVSCGADIMASESRTGSMVGGGTAVQTADAACSGAAGHAAAAFENINWGTVAIGSIVGLILWYYLTALLGFAIEVGICSAAFKSEGKVGPMTIVTGLLSVIMLIGLLAI